MIKLLGAFVHKPMIYSETQHSDSSLFSLCRVTSVRSSAGFICVEKCHLAQAAKALIEREEREGVATGEK